MRWHFITRVPGSLLAMIIMLLMFWVVFGLPGFIFAVIIMAILAAT